MADFEFKLCSNQGQKSGAGLPFFFIRPYSLNEIKLLYTESLCRNVSPVLISLGNLTLKIG